MNRGEVLEAIEDVVVRLYDAALDSRAWPATLALVARLVDGTAALYLKMRPADGAVVVAHGHGLDAELLARSLLTQRAADAYLAEPSNDETPRLTSRREVIELPSSGAPDSMHVISSTIDVDARLDVGLSVFRPRELGPFVAPSVELFEALLPHIERVAKLQIKLGVMEAERDGLFGSLEPLTAGVIIVDEHQRVLFANSAAREIARDEDGLSIRGDELVAATPKETATLHDMLRAPMASTCGDINSTCATIGLSRPSLRRPLAVTAVATEGTRRSPLSGRGSVIVLVTDPEREAEAPVERLVKLFGLTRAEATFAQIVARGTGLAEAAHELDISMNTARTHLKRVFMKTGTRRQAELVRLLLSGVPQVK